MTDTDTIAPSCHDCGEAYGSPRFPDLVLPHAMWARISPSGDENGLLCPNCMCARAEAAGIECRAVFRSGPFFGAGGTHEAMNAQPDTIARLTAEIEEAQRAKDCFQRMTRAHWEALCAMRNSINEYIPMPNTDSGPLFSPEDGPIYADIAERVVADIKESREYALALEQELKGRAEKAERERDAALALRPSPDALQAVTANG
jgi:hypothetical protein